MESLQAELRQKEKKIPQNSALSYIREHILETLQGLESHRIQKYRNDVTFPPLLT